MDRKNQIKVDMSIDDIKNAIIYFLYREQKISGIFDVKFNIKRKPVRGSDPHDTWDIWILDGAEIVVDLNETQVSP
jgi:hypothetical protein